MKFQLISVNKKVLDLEKVDSVIVPTQSGEITILPKHVPLVSSLQPGVLIVKFDKEIKKFAIGGGVVETDGKSIMVLADMVEDGAALDMTAIQAKKEELKKKIEEYKQTGIMDMEKYIELEDEYLKQLVKEKLAGGMI
ncbi:MAG: ATP synthase F1 subunit epsilon [Candidatus Gracilibacteria bacterium]|nr:ATP synthase F1 subunit epsilon [Candidatus Gracilibacteria bacterium]MDD3119865.1 ATP synthase F1 subunit epsilon [Candidatus Gracilibacteria bacterium]MDD4530016.1 ATP synthase F1 subunit epsilon [Candidatus Gracilibacteria bacterium]